LPILLVDLQRHIGTRWEHLRHPLNLVACEQVALSHSINSRRSAAQVLTDLRQELARADGLGNVAIAARGTGLLLSSIQRMGSDRDDRNTLKRLISLKATRSLVPVYPGELDVHKNEVWSMLGRRSEPRLTVHGFDDLEIGAREQIPQDLPIVFLVFDDEDALAHECPACASTRTGTIYACCRTAAPCDGSPG